MNNRLVEPLMRIIGFWACSKWAWPGQTDWTSTLREQEFHATLSLPTSSHHCLSSKELMFMEWTNNFTPPPADNRHWHYPILADPLSVKLHPCTQGVLSTGSWKLQSAVFQIAMGHYFGADYSSKFRPTAGDRTDCSRCGEFYTANHVLENSNCYAIEREGLLDALLKHALTTFTGGQKLAKFLHTNQVFLHPLDPVPSDIPPKPDP